MALPQFGAVMIDYNIFQPERATIIKELAARRFGVLAGMALGGGLYRKFNVRGIRDLWYLARAWKNHRPQLRRARGFQFLNDGRDGTGGEIALAWVLRNPDVSCAVLGTTRMAHLLDNLRASGKIISADVLQKIAVAQSSFSLYQRAGFLLKYNTAPSRPRGFMSSNPLPLPSAVRPLSTGAAALMLMLCLSWVLTRSR